MALTYVCSPLSAPTRAEIMVNAQRARTYMAMCEREFGCRAVAPHAYLPYLLDDSNPEERALALSFGASLLALCDRFVIYGDRISSGMKEEIRRARELGIPILNRQTQLSDGSSDPVIVGRYINGISLNGLFVLAGQVYDFYNRTVLITQRIRDDDGRPVQKAHADACAD